MRAKRNKAKHPAGFRYANKDAWLPMVKEMLDTGATYGAIAKTLGVGHSTVCRFVWANKLASIETHRNTVRAAILKGDKPRQFTPKHYGAKVKCLDCGSVIQSKHRHDFTSCKCGALSIDGGGEYCRMIGKPGCFEQVTPGNYLLK